MKGINKRKQAMEIEESSENLGLDADHSSEGDSLHNRLNNDNDRITGNPKGENDGEDNGDVIDTPLDEK